jgi:dihydropteroate synthase
MRRGLFELKIDGRIIRLGERTLIMGVLNVTPDSFSDGGLYLDPEKACRHAVEMAKAGADWIDVGGESTRPGSRPIPAREELQRVLPVIREIRKRLGSIPISIDTTKAEVAEEAVKAGARILNDVSGLRFDPGIARVARRYNTPLVLMHLRGQPKTMQQRPFVRDVWRSVLEGLRSAIDRALSAGVPRSQLIVDPGLGFGKSRRQNFEILARLDRLREFNLPILVGTSRKSFVQAITRGEGLDPKGSHIPARTPWPLTKPGRTAAREEGRVAPLELGDAAAIVASILGGAHVVRVHDVAAVLPAVRIADAVLAVAR